MKVVARLNNSHTTRRVIKQQYPCILSMNSSNYVQSKLEQSSQSQLEEHSLTRQKDKTDTKWSKQPTSIRDQRRIENLKQHSVTPNSTTTNVVKPKSHINIGPGTLFGPRDDSWWTGLPPAVGCPGYLEKDGHVYSLPQLSFQSGICTKESIQAYFDNTWTLSEVLLGCLQGEESFTRSPYHDLRHPMIFYYGHPAALYVNKLRVAGLLKDPINPYFEVIFETGVDEMSWDDLSKNQMPWPSVAEVHAYRQQVYKTVSALIQSLTDEQCASINQKSPLWALVMGFEHERIHLETSSYLISEMPLEFVRFPEGFPGYHPSIPSSETSTYRPVAGEHYPINHMVSVPEKTVSIGKPRSHPTFGWDNEYGYREYNVPAFSASKFKVTNGEFLEFMRDGGYSRIELWTEVGWSWRAFRNVKMPNLWVRKGPQGHHEYDLRCIFDVVPMPWDWPVAVNFHEAAAFAKWKALKTPGKVVRVMTELEHKAIRDHEMKVDSKLSRMFPVEDHIESAAGYEMVEKAGYNLNLSCSSMSPVNSLPANKLGFHDVFGNAWEWTSDYFAALPGFEVHPYYEDFSTPCFDGLHHVIQGGSFISTGNEASVFSRFHFRPHFYQHASFRLVETDADTILTSDTDAPGPYVGKYPFRRSQTSLLNEMSESKEVDRRQYLNEQLNKHFNTFQLGDALMGAIAQFSNSRLGNNTNAAMAMPTLSGMVLTEVTKMEMNLSHAKLLEVGCGPGSNVFQFAKHFPFVMGIDHDQDLVQVAKNLHSKLSTQTSTEADVSLQQRGEGELVDFTTISLQEYKKAELGTIEFRCADPMCLPAELKGFDVVIFNDIIDKVSSPNSVLTRLGGARGLVREVGGLMVMVSCYQWDANVTPKSLWLGGYKDPVTGADVTSEETLQQRLQEDFDLVNRCLLPTLWQKDARGNITGKLLSATFWSRR